MTAAGETEEVTGLLLGLGQAFDELVVRGLKSVGPEDLRKLRTLGEECSRVGAAHLAGGVETLVSRVREGGDGAKALLRAQTSLRVFERVLSLDVAAEALSRLAGAPGPDSDRPAGAPPVAAPQVEDAKALAAILDELIRAIEGLVSSGLTTASDATRQNLDASLKEASRRRLLRLAASLRYVNEEVGRFLAGSDVFSARRLGFFVNRLWLLAHGLLRALNAGDAAALAALLPPSATAPIDALQVVVVGVQKRALLDGSASFDFRMRAVKGRGAVPEGARLVWSCVFGSRSGVPAEAFLHLPQPQKFSPKILLAPSELTITSAAVVAERSGSFRLLLGPKSTVAAGKPFEKWDRFTSWEPTAALQRVRGHVPSPLDLEVELQEEVVLSDWHLLEPFERASRNDQKVFPLTAGPLTLDAVASTGPDGGELTAALNALRKDGADRPPLYGLMHYEMGRLVFQPLSTIGQNGPRHLMIASEKIDLAALMRTLDFKT